jgi:hypothetical protein
MRGHLHEVSEACREAIIDRRGWCVRAPLLIACLLLSLLVWHKCQESGTADSDAAKPAMAIVMEPAFGGAKIGDLEFAKAMDLGGKPRAASTPAQLV